jgi:hypothetical protein
VTGDADYTDLVSSNLREKSLRDEQRLLGDIPRSGGMPISCGESIIVL